MQDPYHSQLEQKLRDLRYDVNDRFDNPNHPMARVVHNELQKAEDMAQGGQNLRSIEDRLKTVQRTLQQSQNTASEQRMMNPEHSEAFYHQMERMRMDMRRHPRF